MVYPSYLFEGRDDLNLRVFSSQAHDVLKAMGKWLEQVNRHMYLPLDLMIVLLERSPGGDMLDLIVKGADGMVPADEVLRRLKVLSSQIEEEATGVEPRLNRAFFSRGFIRILEEAYAKSQFTGAKLISEDALVQSVILRLEVAESASVRWAVRRLGEGKGDKLFGKKGFLREEIFSPSTWRILEGAVGIASTHGTPFLGTPHLVAMLCSVKDSTLWRSAKARGLEPGRLREELLRLIGHKPNPIPEFLISRKTLTPRMIRMLSYSAEQAGEGQVTEVHLVEGFLADGGSSLELVQALGLESELRKALGEPMVMEQALSVEAAIEFAARRHPTPTLDMLGRDLTEAAMAGKLPDIVGRELELQRVINVLLRREQRNPILCGEAGVGKTALAVGLAQRIASGQVPKKLQGYRVIELNGASLMGGTSYRGDLEARIKSLLEEAKNDIILFIDEAHAVFAPRSSSNSPAEVPNHFKRALASGDIAVVGATTEAEYHRWFEQDSALKRRFERIEIEEPSEPLVAQILKALSPELEEDYQVVIDRDAIDAAIELSVRYLPEQRLPDKAKKLLMDACIARANELVQDIYINEAFSAEHGSAKNNPDKTGSKKPRPAANPSKNDHKPERALSKESAEIKAAVIRRPADNSAISVAREFSAPPPADPAPTPQPANRDDDPKSLHSTNPIVPAARADALLARLSISEESLAASSVAADKPSTPEQISKASATANQPPLVGREDVARQVCMKTGIPLERLLRGEISWWVGIEKRLSKWVLGQAPAIRQVAHALVTSRLRHAGKERPMAVLLFVGPAGVGKSTLAHALAREVFNDPRAVIRLDMNDFQESHSMSRLIGSPPGYVGYEDEDLFVTPLRRRPSSVVLFEDFDRAHPGIQQRILRLIEDGQIDDTRGHRADVRNSLFIFTIHADTSRNAGGIGFTNTRAGVSAPKNSAVVHAPKNSAVVHAPKNSADVHAPSQNPAHAQDPHDSQSSQASLTEMLNADARALDVLDSAMAAQLRGHLDAAVAFHALGHGSDAAVELLERRIDAFIDALSAEYHLKITLADSLNAHLHDAAALATDARQIEELVNHFLYLPMTQTLLSGTHATSATLEWDDALGQVRITS